MLKKMITSALLAGGSLFATEYLDVQIVDYNKLIQRDKETIETINTALHNEGLIAVKGIPGQREAYEKYLQASMAFHSLSKEQKAVYTPSREGGDILGYEQGAESYDGTVVDDLKTSYYAHYPDCPENRWPSEVDLRTPFLELSKLMCDTGEVVMREIGLIGEKTGIELAPKSRLGRILYYKKGESAENPNWCGAHFDHSMFTALLPAMYFVNGERVDEPEEAGLFVRTDQNAPFKKVRATDTGLVLFQVGEFSQLLSNDGIRATEHVVRKAEGEIERYTLAIFCDAPMDTVIRSTSVLTSDSRYAGNAGDPCSYKQWSDATFERFLVKDKK